MSAASEQVARDFGQMPEAYRVGGVPCPDDCTCRGMAERYVPASVRDNRDRDDRARELRLIAL